jgi:carboxymethylenebutenolidase
MMSGQSVSIKSQDGQVFSGYLARPEIPNGAGVLVIQEIFGVNSHIRDVANLYAAAGFVALAPDLFWRTDRNFEIAYSEAEIQKGIGIMMKTDPEKAIEDLASSASALRTEYGAKHVGCVGYCMGGLYTFRLACRNVVNAAIAYYGGGTEQFLGEATQLNTPLLMHFALNDAYIPLDAINKIKTAFTSNPHVQIDTYPGVDHGFNCDQRGSYNRQTAMLAFARSLTFFNNHLLG